ncbi:hypothetical protein [Candidatus Poriferisodalis sp.]|uniref:hypothetical protein n=1 Tax=Candidatus Poriferisodalis sp. TaxID=3101277 RepID=UPI003C702B33
MSEQDRAQLYAWLCEQTNEPLAEYLMSCLAPAPLSDLATKDDLARFATKDDLRSELEKYPTKDDLRSELEKYPTKEHLADRFEALCARMDTKFDRLADQREADRRTSARRFYWSIIAGISAAATLLAAISKPAFVPFF